MYEIDCKLHKIARELKNAILDYMENPEDTWRLAYINMYKSYYLKLKKKKEQEESEHV